MHSARRRSSVGKLESVAHVNENMKGKLELATAAYKQVITALAHISLAANINFHTGSLIGAAQAP